MPRDRLKELKEKAGFSNESQTPVEVRKSTSISDDPASQPLIDQDADFEMFLERCTNLRDSLKSLEEDYNEIKNLHGILLSTPGADAENSDKLNNHAQLFFSKATQIQNSLKILSNDTISIPSNACGKARTKMLQVQTIYKTYETVMMKFNTEQEEYRDKAKRKIVEYLKIRNMQLSDEEIEDAVSSGNLSELTKGVMLALNEKKALYDDVKSRTDDIKNVERNIRELAQLFHDLHLLVVNQGEMVDSIQVSVESAKQDADKARGHVAEARRLQKRARKMKVCIIIGAVIAVIILLMFFQAAVCHFTPIC